MNYQKIYNNIIQHRLNTPLPKGVYTEKHHIMPLSLGGSNDKNNLVNLLAREHFICHLLLTKMYPEKSIEWVKMIKAFMMMYQSSSSHSNQRYSNNKWYEYLKINFSKAQSLNQRGENNSGFGTTWLCNYELNKTIKVKKENLQKYLDEGWIKGRIIDTKNHYSSKDCLYVKKDGIKKRINKFELQDYLNKGWSWGNKKKEQKNINKCYILIYNEETGEKIKINKNELQKYLNKGWIQKTNKKFEYGSKRTNQKLINNGYRQRFVFNYELQKYLDKGWMIGGIKGIKTGIPKSFRTKEHCIKLKESNIGKHKKLK